MIESSLQQMQTHRRQGLEIIIVDGGSSDNTLQLAEPFADKLLKSQPGRAAQMNHGAQHAVGDLLLFLHIDTVFPGKCFNRLFSLHQENCWGRFDVELSNPKLIFKIIAFLMNLRSRLTHIATGDQCIFISQKLFKSINGYPDIALMEDIAISKLLRKKTKPIIYKEKVVTSARRWEENGVINTIVLMWFLRLAYFFNISPKRLKTLYE